MAGSWLRRWLFTTYHKDIGILYLVTSLYFGFIGGLLAMLMRAQLSGPSQALLQPGAFNQALTMHGLIMVLWFLSPFAIAYANYFVPLQIGAKDLALPRLNAMSYWIYLFGGVLAVLAFFMPGGNTAGGWTAYAPLSSTQFSPGAGPTLAFAGLIMLAISITLGSINILLTVAHLRAPGITWRKVPMFTWFVIFTMLAMLFSFPSLLAGLLLLMSDRLLGTFYFVSSAGGMLLWTNLFWFFGHPEVYVVLLPAFGVIAEILPVFSGRQLAEKNILLLATGAVVVPLSYLVWQHHMFITGIDLRSREAFSITTILISLPFDLITLSFIKSLSKGYIRLTTPMLFAIGSILLFIIGGITGVFLSSFVLDVVLRGTYFVVAHFHYVMVGAAIFGLFAGTYYWLPKMTGRMYNEKIGKLHFIISFIGFNMLYFPMFFLYEMPRRIYTYTPDTGWGSLNLMASIGGLIFAGAQILFIANLIYTLKSGSLASPNPWGATTLEWAVGISGGSTPQTSTVDSHPHETHVSSRPVTLSLGMMVTFLGLALLETGFGLPFFFLGAVLLAWALVGWARDDLHEKFSIAEEISERWPFHGVERLKLGMWIFLSTEIVVFGAIIASYLFIRANMPNWPAPGTIHEISIGLSNTMVLLTSGLTTMLAIQSIRSGNQRGLLLWLTATFILGAIFMGIKGVEWYDLFIRSPPFTFASGLPASTYYFTVGIHGAHVTAGLIMMLYLIKKTLNGGYAKESHIGVTNFGLYWAFVDIVWMFVFPLFYLL
jgi:cytochrome c oxidase subunit I+III